MKRFITVAKQHAGEVLTLIRNGLVGGAAGAAGVDGYNLLKQHLAKKQISHNDQQASHQSQLPHQGGYVSFYIGPDGKWMQADH